MFSIFFRFKVIKFVLLYSLILYSCSTNSPSLKSSILQKEDINGNFTIEGKFKIKLNNQTQFGYFVIDKIDSSVSLKVGKNYLLPGRKFFYKMNSYISLEEITGLNEDDFKERLSLKEIKVNNFIKALLGNPASLTEGNWELIYKDYFQVVEGYKFPKKIQFINESVKLEIILNRIVAK